LHPHGDPHARHASMLASTVVARATGAAPAG
jgi:hypothetical protein